jgi:hypothetical protein
MNDTDPNTAFGMLCNQQASADDTYYYFAITPSAQYVIAKAEAGQTDIFLTNNDEWGTSASITKNQPPTVSVPTVAKANSPCMWMDKRLLQSLMHPIPQAG